MNINDLKEYLPFLIPYIAVEFALMLVALIHVLRHKNYKVGNRVLWVVVVVCFQIIGPICYFAFGRSDE
jgi:hypothetical protein